MDLYQYTGLDLTGRMMIEIFNTKYVNKRFSRKEAIEYAIEYHKAHGGVCNKESYVATFKAATRLDKRFENIGYGVWQINEGENIEVLQLTPPTTSKPSVVVDKTVGLGEESIYVYYYDTYKNYHALKGESKFPCKIGMARKDNPLDRIVGQSSTAYPELPHVALVIKCDNARKLETLIHSVLSYKNQKMEDAPGNEWYITNSDEVESIYMTLK